jgi:hypothetical protein
MTETQDGFRPNRRLTGRLACLLSVRYRSGKSWHPATVIDVSLNGCRLRVGEDLARDHEVTVSFERPISDGASAASLETPGRVVWTRREGLSYQAGIHFPSEPAGLADLLGEIRRNADGA